MNFYNNRNEEFNNNCLLLSKCNDDNIFIKYLQENPICKEQKKIIENSNNNLVIDKKILDSKKLLYKYVLNGQVINPTLAFNGSIIINKKKKDEYIFVYRTDLKFDNIRYCVKINIHIVKLDKDFNIINKPQILNLYTDVKAIQDTFLTNFKLIDGEHAEDPRLFYVNDNLFICYGDGYNMYQGLINIDTLKIIESFKLQYPCNTHIEMHWSPLIKDNNILYLYSYSPKIIFFKMNKNKIDYIFSKDINDDIINWENKYGKIRGGTPFIYLNELEIYISVYHSSKILFQDIENSRIYYSGIIILDKNLNIKNVSKKPLYSPDIINPIRERLNNKICVIFPSGLTRNKKYLIVSCGENDYNNIVFKLNINLLYSYLN
jgi:predicted GH43/DUF377 family glycosyl hydrolase